MADRRVAAPSGSYGGRLSQPVQCIVVHSLEAPATPGMAYSLATGWLQHERVSIHAITDPVESIDMVGLDTVAYHCGGGNSHSAGDEVTGYAAWTTAQWLEPRAFAALRLDAKKVAEQALKLDIPRRWLKIAQIKAGERGIITHNDARLAFGGTTHTDPGPGFPYEIFMQMVQQFAGDIVDPETNPNPTSPGEGGAQAETEDDDMTLLLNDGSRTGVLQGGLLTHLGDSFSVAGFTDAGVKTAKVSPESFDKIKRTAVQYPLLANCPAGKWGILGGSQITWLQDVSTVRSLQAAGSETVSVSDADFEALLARA